MFSSLVVLGVGLLGVAAPAVVAVMCGVLVLRLQPRLGSVLLDGVEELVRFGWFVLVVGVLVSALLGMEFPATPMEVLRAASASSSGVEGLMACAVWGHAPADGLLARFKFRCSR